MVLIGAMINPATGVLIFVITGVSGVMTYVAFRSVTKVGPKVELADLRPMMPWEGPPLPVFTKTKPEVLQALTER